MMKYDYDVQFHSDAPIDFETPQTRAGNLPNAQSFLVISCNLDGTVMKHADWE